MKRKISKRIHLGIIYILTFIIVTLIFYLLLIYAELNNYIPTQAREIYLLGSLCLSAIFCVGLIDHIDTKRKRTNNKRETNRGYE